MPSTSNFIDVATIWLHAGKGGDGAVSFHREKFVAAGGPDGGDGGRGGNIVFQADPNLSTLMDFRYKRKYTAPDGENGRGARQKGKDADDLVIRVPRGTVLKEAETDLVVADLTGSEPVVVAKGGRGSGKSSYLSMELVWQLLRHPDCHAVVLRKVGGTLRNSVYNQVVWAIGELGCAGYFRCTVSPMECTYLPTGQKILFFGTDDPGKLKSLKLPFGAVGICWFEELDQFDGPEEVRNVEQTVLRGGSWTLTLKSFNPPAAICRGPCWASGSGPTPSTCSGRTWRRSVMSTAARSWAAARRCLPICSCGPCRTTSWNGMTASTTAWTGAGTPTPGPTTPRATMRRGGCW